MFLTVLFPLTISAQNIRAVEGAVVFQSNEVHSGCFLIDHKMATVFQVLDSGLQVYLPHRLKYIFYYDADLNMNRKFEFKPDPKTGYPTAYEIIFRGYISLYRKSKWADNKYEHDSDYEYICQLYNEWIPLQKFRTRIYPILKSQFGDKLLAFMKTQSLNANNPADAIRIMQFCNEEWEEAIPPASDPLISGVSAGNKS